MAAQKRDPEPSFAVWAGVWGGCYVDRTNGQRVNLPDYSGVVAVVVAAAVVVALLTIITAKRRKKKLISSKFGFSVQGNWAVIRRFALPV